MENRLVDLWSIFDFVNPGLLGSGQAFARASPSGSPRGPTSPYGPLRELVRPYVLRRLKTDPTRDRRPAGQDRGQGLLRARRKQAALYAESVKELGDRIAGTEGIAAKGLILAFLTRFKQICNHPSHWLGDAAWAEADSGKLARLREIAEVLAARQEKVLVFTQFREATAPLAAHLGSVFGREGLVLHGETPVKNRSSCGGSRKTASPSSCSPSRPGAPAST